MARRNEKWTAHLKGQTFTRSAQSRDYSHVIVNEFLNGRLYVAAWAGTHALAKRRWQKEMTYQHGLNNMRLATNAPRWVATHVVACALEAIGKAAPISDAIPAIYEIVEDGKAITCLKCGTTSWSRKDVQERYCGHCHQFHQEMMAEASSLPTSVDSTDVPATGATEGRTCPGCGCSERNACVVHSPHDWLGLGEDESEGCSWVPGSDLCSACLHPETRVSGPMSKEPDWITMHDLHDQLRDEESDRQKELTRLAEEEAFDLGYYVSHGVIWGGPEADDEAHE